MNERIPYERVWAGRSRIKCIAALTHPTAVILFSFATLVLALLASPRQANLITVVLLTSGMAASQAGNGLLNEVLDRDLDQRFKPWRAIPAGYIQPREAAALAISFFLIGLLCAQAVSVGTMLLLFFGTGAGVLYSLKLKRTRLSWLPYVIAYPSLPVWVLVGMEKFDARVLWIYLLAAPFAAGIHLTNQLRDYEEDSLAGVRGAAQHLGKERAIWATFLLLSLGPLFSLIVFVFTGMQSGTGLILATSLLHWALVLPLPWFPVGAMTAEAFRSLFRRLQVSCLLLLIAWFWAFLH